MSDGLQIAAWAIPTALVVLLNLRWKGDPDGLGAAFMLALIWVCERVLAMLWGEQQSSVLWPLFDFCGGATMFLAWLSRRQGWKLVMVGLFLADLLVEASYQAATYLHGPSVAFITVALPLNLLYSMQLMVVGWRGLRDYVLGGGARSGLRLRPGPRHHTGPR